MNSVSRELQLPQRQRSQTIEFRVALALAVTSRPARSAAPDGC
jgi:hypothetical protein